MVVDGIKMPKLICTVGLPRSGKSTWAHEQGFPIVNRDSVRLALHGERFIPQAEPLVAILTKFMVEALFLAGHDTVIVDETNMTRKRRDFWRLPFCNTYFKHIDTSEEVCLERANQEYDFEILSVIKRMAEEFEPLGEDEAKLE
jgi:predicted kinase